MKFAGFGLLILISLGFVACTTNSTDNTVPGVLYVAGQGDTAISAYSIDLNTGELTVSSKTTPTGNMPSAMVLSPASQAAFVINSQDNTISSYTVNPDSTLTAGSGTTATGTTPTGLAISADGKFLFVANQGSFADPASGTVSVYSVSSATLAPVGSYGTEEQGATTGNGPVAVAVSPNGQYVYTANQFTNTVSGFSVDGATGALSPLGQFTYNTRLNPSGLVFTPDGNFLYVANQGSNNLTVFAACTNTTLACPTPDGHLSEISGSPFSVGLGPIAMATASDSQGEYLFVADYLSSQISAFKVGRGTGVLTATAPPTVSTGGNPSSIVVRAGIASTTTGGTLNYVYTANRTGGNISGFSYDSTVGALTQITGSPVTTTSGQPAALALR